MGINSVGRPAGSLQRTGLTKRMVPFAVPFLVGVGVVLATSWSHETAPYLIASVVVTILLIVAAQLFPWERLPSWCEAIPPLGALGVVLLIGSGTGSSLREYAPLMLLPLFWIALHGTRLQLVAGYGLAAVSLVTSEAIWGGLDRDAATFVILALLSTIVICFRAQTLVNEVREKSRLLESLAHTDALTGIPNRRGWEAQLPRELARARREGSGLCVAMVDLDHFKSYNDRYGHQGGDQLLRAATAEWSEELRASDVIARLGGEEFGILLPACRTAEAVEIVNRLRINTPEITSSAGVAEWDGEESSDVLFARADAALYRAKRTGRDRTVAASTTSIARAARGSLA